MTQRLRATAPSASHLDGDSSSNRSAHVSSGGRALAANPRSMSNYYRHCSTCKKPIAFGELYFRCSVSTCNQKRTGLFFCSVACWDAHVPGARHRDAWAEQTTAPLHEETEDLERPDPGTEPNKRIISPRAISPKIELNEPADSDEILVVVSKLKKYIADSADMNTSAQGMGILSAHLRRVCDRAVQVARADGRKTVLDRDFETVIRRLDTVRQPAGE